MGALIETLIYAAALDMYRRSNARSLVLSRREMKALLETVAWESRPCLLSRD